MRLCLLLIVFLGSVVPVYAELEPYVHLSALKTDYECGGVDQDSDGWAIALGGEVDAEGHRSSYLELGYADLVRDTKSDSSLYYSSKREVDISTIFFAYKWRYSIAEKLGFHTKIGLHKSTSIVKTTYSEFLREDEIYKSRQREDRLLLGIGADYSLLPNFLLVGEYVVYAGNLFAFQLGGEIKI